MKRFRVNPGDLRKPITFYTRTVTPSASGGSTPVYTPTLSNVRARDYQKQMPTVDTSGKLVFQTFHIYTVRFSPDITEGMYIKDPDDPTNYYIVQGVVDPEGTRIWLEVSATQYNG